MNTSDVIMRSLSIPLLCHVLFTWQREVAMESQISSLSAVFTVVQSVHCAMGFYCLQYVTILQYLPFNIFIFMFQGCF